MNADLRGRFDLHETALRGARSLFEASVSVERDEWRRYVAGLDPAHRLPDLRGIGFLFLLPLYQEKAVLDTVEQSPAALLGWVYAPFLVEDLLRTVPNIDELPISFRIHDANQPRNEALLYTPSSPPAAPIHKRTFTATHSFAIGGQRWSSAWSFPSPAPAAARWRSRAK